MAYFKEWDLPPSVSEILNDKCIACPNRIANPHVSCDSGVLHGFAINEEGTYSIEVCGQDLDSVNHAPTRILYGVVTSLYKDIDVSS